MEAPLKASKVSHQWELTERLEAYELKIMKGFSVPRSVPDIVSQCDLWESCFSELLPMMSKRHSEIIEVIQKVHSNILTLFKELKSAYDQEMEKSCEKVSQMQEQISGLEGEIIDLQGSSEEMKKVRNCLLYTSPSPRDS